MLNDHCHRVSTHLQSINIIIIIKAHKTWCHAYWCRIHLWFRLMGGLQAKSMTSPRYRAFTRWRICVTMATLWQQKDGGYALLFYIFNSTVIDWTCFLVFFFKEIGHYSSIVPSCKSVKGLTRTDSQLWVVPLGEFIDSVGADFFPSNFSHISQMHLNVVNGIQYKCFSYTWQHVWSCIL